MSPFLLSITGAHSGCGKTSLAEMIIKRISIPWGAVKYTPSDLYASLIDDRDMLMEQGKDTARFLAAGAESVLWIQSPEEELDELLPLALGRLAYCRAILIEGNSPALRCAPDAVIFVFGNDYLNIKPSGLKVLEKAHYVVCPPGTPIKTPGKVYNKNSEKDIVVLCDDLKKWLAPDQHGTAET